MGQHVIEIPGVGNVEFPASMTMEQMNAEAARLYREKQPPAAPPPAPAPMSKGQQILRAQVQNAPISDSPPTGMEAFRQRLAAALEPGAHPQSLEDVASLIFAPTDASRGAVANMPTAIRAAKDVPRATGSAVSMTRRPVAAAARIGGNVLESDLANVVEPRAKPVGSFLKRFAAWLEPTPSAASASPAAPAAPPVIAAPAPPPIAPPAAAAPPVAPPPVAPAAASASSPAAASALTPKQAIDAAVQAAGAKVTGREMADLFTAVKSGQPADEALRDLLKTRATPAAPAAAAAPKVTDPGTQLMAAAKKAGMLLKSDEFSGGVELMNKHMTPDEVIDFIQKVRELPDSFKNLPSRDWVEQHKLFDKMGRKS